MDISPELWTSKLIPKQNQLLQLLGDRQFNSDDLDLDDDARSTFACPYCDDDFDVVSLCSHLEEDHCTNGKLSMCPVCAAPVENDVVGHISAQHASLFKASRKSRSRKLSTSLQALLDATRATNSTTESLLQLLVSSEEALKREPRLKQELVDDEPELSSGSPALSSEEKAKRVKQAACRAKFVQHLVLSSVWPDS